jgi:hypothetical protein
MAYQFDKNHYVNIANVQIQQKAIYECTRCLKIASAAKTWS